jgi:hypothetical protein
VKGEGDGFKSAIHNPKLKIPGSPTILGKTVHFDLDCSEDRSPLTRYPCPLPLVYKIKLSPQVQESQIPQVVDAEPDRSDIGKISNCQCLRSCL